MDIPVQESEADMEGKRIVRLATRREMLQATATSASGALVARLLPGKMARAATWSAAQQAGAPPVDSVATFVSPAWPKLKEAGVRASI